MFGSCGKSSFKGTDIVPESCWERLVEALQSMAEQRSIPLFFDAALALSPEGADAGKLPSKYATWKAKVGQVKLSAGDLSDDLGCVDDLG